MNAAFVSRFLLLLFAGLFVGSTLFAQVTPAAPKTRVYANQQTPHFTPFLSSVSNGGDAVDTDPATASTTNSTLNINISILGVGNASQDLKFPAAIPDATYVTVKLGIPVGFLTLLPNLSISGINGSNNIGSVVSVLGSGGQKELSLLTNNANYQQLTATLGGVANIAAKADVYAAYYETTAGATSDCDQLKAYDVISGVAFAANLITPIAGLNGVVTTPEGMIDNSLATAAVFHNSLVTALGSIYAIAALRSNYTPGDQVSVTFGNSTGNFAVSVLQNVKVTTYVEGNRAATEESHTLDESIISIFNNSSSVKTASFTPTKEFNRVEVSLNTAVGVLGISDFMIYDVKRAYAPNLAVGSDNKIIYSGHTATLTSTPTATGDGANWFAHDDQSTSLASTASFTTPVLTSTTLYDVYATGRYNCPDISARAVSTVTVLNVNKPNPVNGIIAVPYSSGIQVTGPDAAGRIYNYTLSAGSLPLPPGLTLNLDGTITGTPTTLGFYPFKVDIVDVTGGGNIPVNEEYPYSIAIRKVEVLPVTLEYFNAQPKSNGSLLTWATAGGQNNKGFGIERSADASNWNALGTVESKSAGGNSSTVYSFTDMHVNNGVNYYRLKLIDVNGNYSYSKIVKVEFVNGRMKVSIYPNPTTSSFYIDGIVDGSQLRVFDAVGKLILRKDLINNHHMVNLEGFANGSYFMIIRDKDNQTSKHMIIKK